MPQLVRDARRFGSIRKDARDRTRSRRKGPSVWAMRRGMSAEERPAGEGKVRLRVQVSGMVTQRAYESALEELGSAVQFPGFKKKRGGKSDPLPSSLILQVVGKSKVKQFAVDGLVIEAVCDYAQEKGYQVNRNLSAAGIVENIKEIRSSFGPGEDLVFDAEFEVR